MLDECLTHECVRVQNDDNCTLSSQFLDALRDKYGKEGKSFGLGTYDTYPRGGSNECGYSCKEYVYLSRCETWHCVRQLLQTEKTPCKTGCTWPVPFMRMFSDEEVGIDVWEGQHERRPYPRQSRGRSNECGYWCEEYVASSRCETWHCVLQLLQTEKTPCKTGCTWSAQSMSWFRGEGRHERRGERRDHWTALYKGVANAMTRVEKYALKRSVQLQYNCLVFCMFTCALVWGWICCALGHRPTCHTRATAAPREAAGEP